MTVSDYILNGICNGCDMDPISCLEKKECFYDARHDKKQEENKEKENNQ